MPASGPPWWQRSSMRAETAGSSSTGGAWCGLSRASMTNGPLQPQCLWWVVASTPWMSTAGFDRVNVTQRKFSSAAATKAESSTTTIKGNARSGCSGPMPPQNCSISPAQTASAVGAQIAASLYASSRGRGSIRGPSTATIPGPQTRGFGNPSGRPTPGGRTVGRSRTAGPLAATTSFDPALKPWPE